MMELICERYYINKEMYIIKSEIIQITPDYKKNFTECNILRNMVHKFLELFFIQHDNKSYFTTFSVRSLLTYFGKN